MAEARALVPVRIILFGLSGNSTILVKERGVLRLPETWLKEGETICSAARRLATQIAGNERLVKVVAVVWFAEVKSENDYHLVFAVEAFIDSDVIQEHDNILLLKTGDAAKLVDDPVHRQFLTTIVFFKPRPLLVCEF
ncbi:hypothetical protein Pyrfu_0300 [Pyrolobus fumarii 1A]|uniref:Nudix hydrolase domain-containing protein n=1 Tax=Pyrolobus fumarii (strain DSM 11204 / 1A) TaxID=694429 RepID=G0EFC9_PYRF1|nr:hypothetical protein [Pyrolobus fumarii]AEM38172.1 hypothetical protein Pyrfu_0300 [Pyrolobus fumarii 1A]